MAENEVLGPPPGCAPMMMTEEQMQKYDLKTGPDMFDVVDYKLFDKQEAIAEYTKIGFYSAFHDFREKIPKYPENEILVVADKEEKYGQNWLICLTEEAKHQQLKVFEDKKAAEEAAKRAAEEEVRRKQEEEERLANMVYEDKPLIPRPYESEEAENTFVEVDNMALRASRPLIRVRLSRAFKEFGRPVNFGDRQADGNTSADYRSHKDPAFGELSRKVVEVNLQATPGIVHQRSDSTTQTVWFRRVNSSTQYEPRQGDAVESEQEMRSERMASFLKSVRPVCEEALQHNETLDLQRDEVAELGDEEVSFGDEAEAGLKELRSFTDLRYSKGHRLTALDWHPTKRGVVAVACGENMSYDQRVEVMGRASTSYLLVWSFADLIHPQIVLESPEEVTCFRFNPDNPNLVAGGTMSGQVVSWDLTAAFQRLQKRGGGRSAKPDSRGAGKEEEKEDSLPRVTPTAASAIELSHKRPVASLRWMPDRMEVGARGAVTVNDEQATNQFVSVAGDGQVLVWDLRYKTQVKRRPMPGQSHKKKEEVPPWGPMFKLPLTKPGSMSPLNLCTLVVGGLDRMGRLFCGSEEGELCAVEWPAEKGMGKDGAVGGIGKEDGEGRPDFVQWAAHDHFRPAVALRQSPFFPDLLLSVGDWSFNLWRETMQQPVFSSPAAEANLMCGLWSPTRPAVIFLGRSDGRMDVWDLADQTHKPVLSEPVASGKVTSMEFYSAKGPGGAMQQLLAVGDEQGNLHVLDLPRLLSKPLHAEKETMQTYVLREARRVEYVNERAAAREEGAAGATAVDGDAEAGDEDLARVLGTAGSSSSLDESAGGAAADLEGLDDETRQRREEEQRKRREEEEKLEKEYKELEDAFRRELGLEGEVATGDVKMSVK